jgi:benzodiazapine receptor
MTRSSRQQLLGLIGFLVLCFVAAGLGALASLNAESFYGALNKPSWAPPGSIFGPVWSVLYTLMAISAWLVWRIGLEWGRSRALQVFLIQLIVNACWSWLFFYFQSGLWSMVNIVVLWLLVAWTLILFSRHDGLAALLLVPYILWVTFAAALNYSVWMGNPGVL